MSTSTNTCSNTWCFLTRFVCRYEDLNEAKARHQRCVDTLRPEHKVHFCSEQAFQLGQSEPIFTNLVSEILYDREPSDEELEDYSVFCFATVVDVAEQDSVRDEDPVLLVARTLEIDFEEGLPAKFPSRTRGIRVSQSGREIDGCEYQ